MRLSFPFYSPASLSETAAFISSTAGMKTFKGWGIVPGIRSTKPLSEGWYKVRDRFGISHREQILQKEEDLLRMKIYPSFPEKLFVQELEEEWRFKEMRAGVLVERNFFLHSKRDGWLKLVLPSFVRAVEKNNKALARALSEGTSPGDPLEP